MPETAPQGQLDEATMDLLIKQVTEGLSPAEQRALDVLDGAVTSTHFKEFERAAAAITLAGIEALRPLPAALAQRLLRKVDEQFGAAAGVGRPAGAHIVDLAAARSAAARLPPARAATSQVYGWWAAAACLVLALFAWNRPPPSLAQVETRPAAVPVSSKPATPAIPAEERAALMANPNAMKVVFGATKDPAAAGVRGDVVWDPITQRGFMHFEGLAANDPKLRQYQLWIFDGDRDQRYPVDGGVFDIPADATEVVIPIHAALPVMSAKAFAVTIEKPGGVVVSGREHIVALGAV